MHNDSVVWLASKKPTVFAGLDIGPTGYHVNGAVNGLSHRVTIKSIAVHHASRLHTVNVTGSRAKRGFELPPSRLAMAATTYPVTYRRGGVTVDPSKPFEG